MRAMRRRVREHDVARWAADFLDTLNGTPSADQPAWEPEAS
jgi:Trehalose-6-phosphate synthase